MAEESPSASQALQPGQWQVDGGILEMGNKTLPQVIIRLGIVTPVGPGEIRFGVEPEIARKFAEQMVTMAATVERDPLGIAKMRAELGMEKAP